MTYPAYGAAIPGSGVPDSRASQRDRGNRAAGGESATADAFDGTDAWPWSDLPAIRLLSFGDPLGVGDGHAAGFDSGTASFPALRPPALTDHTGPGWHAPARPSWPSGFAHPEAPWAADFLLRQLEDAGIRADVAKALDASRDPFRLDHAALIHVLQDAAAGGVTAAEFRTLKTLDGLVSKPGGFRTSAYDAYITHALIAGDPANVDWTGGSAGNSVPLGNLAAGSSELQADRLIGKWFLGTDHPGLKDSSGATAEYALDPDPLYGSSGTPRWQDFHQAGLGDCYLVAAVGQIALREPGAITSMFTDNHDGTYGVRFYDWNDKPVYVTVDSQIPYFKTPDPVTGERVTPFGGPEIGATDRAKWGALIEKAYVQLNDSGTEYDHDVLAQYAKKYGPNAIPYLGEERGNHYIDIQAGYSELIHYVTGKHVTETENIEDPNILNALRGNQEVILSFNGEDSDRFLSQHMYQVLDYREDTHAFELRNPWGSNDYCVFWATPEKITAQKPEIFYASGATHFAAEA
ncbi:C2 family cysteine protease [Methylobacterium sp. JK268]